jgi:hypothetical protein
MEFYLKPGRQGRMEVSGQHERRGFVGQKVVRNHPNMLFGAKVVFSEATPAA